jgi:hypothetical protein
MANIHPDPPKPPGPGPGPGPLPPTPPVPSPFTSREQYAEYLLDLQRQTIHRLKMICASLESNLGAWQRLLEYDKTAKLGFEGYISGDLTQLHGIMPTLRKFNKTTEAVVTLWPPVINAWNAVMPGAARNELTVANTSVKLAEFKRHVDQLT